MAKDVAQRSLDLAGLRVANIGTPTDAGDATRTDNATAPLAARRNASPGVSLLAAAVDHIHPLQPDLFTLSDPSLQIVDARREIWFAVIDFDQLVGDQVQVGLAGMLQGCLLLAWLDGQVGNPTAGTLVMNINNPSPDLAAIAGVSSAPFARPAGAHLLSLTAEPFTPGTPGQTSGRTVTLRGLF